jgi:hypothetical protein
MKVSERTVGSFPRPVAPPPVIGQPTVWREALRDRLGDRTAQIGVVGLGYVGLSLLLHVRRAGFPAVGVDSDSERITAIRARARAWSGRGVGTPAAAM